MYLVYYATQSLFNALNLAECMAHAAVSNRWSEPQVFYLCHKHVTFAGLTSSS
jgi:hypothetical protein